MKILSVVGARPNFMKIAPIISAIREFNRCTAGAIGHILVHTGQHYDERMSGAFFRDLGLPDPDIYLNAGSAPHAVQTAEIMKRFEPVLLKETPDVVLVVGDVNSTLACALAASKIEYPAAGRRRPLVAHVEAGLRSFDRSMPEEINRVLTDHISDFLFITEESARENLEGEGIPEEKIFFVGNTMIDTLLACREKAEASPIIERLGLSDASAVPYALLTLHRPSNVDDRRTLLGIAEALTEISHGIPVLFPVHPRTLKCIAETGMDTRFRPLNGAPAFAINTLEPLGYIDFLSLMMHAAIVFTDSGGIQEETTCLGVPCITIRENTERPVTVKDGTNIIAGTNKNDIIHAFHEQQNRARGTSCRPKLWDGMAAQRIINVIADKLLPVRQACA